MNEINEVLEIAKIIINFGVRIVKYLDANVFILSAISSNKKGCNARKIIESTTKGAIQCATSTLTFDEVVWGITKQRKDRDHAITFSKYALDLPNLQVLPVSRNDLLRALMLMGKYPNLRPRDAIHVSVCLNNGIHTIVTDDSDFDDISELQRENLE